ncbi:serine beta-lactamase-like protein LACTB, mitochondrial isoform X2 [Glandiceps talaboti]
MSLKRDKLQQHKRKNNTWHHLENPKQLEKKKVKWFGYSDVENRVKCKSETIMRIASISKPLTMVAVAKLWEDGKLNLDLPIQDYVPEFPEKTFEGEKVTVTTRHLLSHLSGIRHYSKKYMEKKNEDEINKKDDKGQKDDNKVTESKACGRSENPLKKNSKETDSNQKESRKDEKDLSKCKEEKSDQKIKNDVKKKNEDESESDDNFSEFQLKKKYKSVTESLNLFKDDPLMDKPGNKHHYTTHGFTLVSAVVEGASKEKFIPHMKQIFKELGLQNTMADDPEPLIYNRASYYCRKDGKLVNAPYVDVSYKWAGGGFLSNVHDLVKFGNVMLYSYQIDSCQQENSTVKLLPGYLKPATMKEMWTSVKSAKAGKTSDEYAGLGWFVSPEIANHGHCRYQEYYLNHTGGAIGASSILLVLPSALPLGESCSNTDELLAQSAVPPKGVVVAIVVNLQGLGLRALALDIAKAFEGVKR